MDNAETDTTITAGPLDLIAATTTHLELLMARPGTFQRAYGLAVEPGYLDALEVLAICREALELDPTRSDWWCRIAVLRDEKRVVGFGGYKGVPTDGTVEIGYQIAPTYRGRGLATAMARGLVAHAWKTPAVTAVIAHTAPTPSASTHILTALGFTHLGPHPDDRFPTNLSWLWRLHRP